MLIWNVVVCVGPSTPLSNFTLPATGPIESLSLNKCPLFPDSVFGF